MKRILMLLSALVLGATMALGQPVKVGILMGFTGGLAALAPAIEDGALLAADQANAAGGLYGGKIETISRDTQTNPGAGRDAASKLVEVDRVPAIVGALSSGVTTAVSSVTIPDQVVLISPSSTAPSLTDLDDNGYFFRTAPSDALQGKVLARLAHELKYKRASVIYVNNPYGKGLADTFRRDFEKGGAGRVVAMVPYEENKPSYRGEVEKALKAKPDVLNVIAYPADGNKQLVTAVEQGYKGAYLFSDGMKSGDVANGPAREQVNGFFGTAAGSKDTSASRAFEKDYADFLKRTGRAGDVSAPYRKEAYDAMAVIILAAAAVGPEYAKMAAREQGKAIRDNIRKVTGPEGIPVGYHEFKKAFDLLRQGKRINYNGVSGPITFDKNGDPEEAVFEIWKFSNGKVVSVRTVE